MPFKGPSLNALNLFEVQLSSNGVKLQINPYNHAPLGDFPEPQSSLYNGGRVLQDPTWERILWEQVTNSGLWTEACFEYWGSKYKVLLKQVKAFKVKFLTDMMITFII